MNNFFSIFDRMFRADAVTTVCLLVLLAVALTTLWLYRKHSRADNSPDLLDYDGYYKIARTPTGYSATDRNNLFRTLDGFCYLRKDPFSIEVSIDEIEADNGKKYRALAVAMTIMPEDRIDFVCRKYFSGAGSSSDNSAMAAIMNSKRSQESSAADILLEQRVKDRNTSSDELLKQILSGNTPASSSARKNGQAKTNCDAEIDMDLTIAFSATLKKLVKEQAGTMTDEELKKKFLGQAMLAAMSAGHAVTEIPVFNIIEITE